MMLQAGFRAPDFILRDQSGGEVQLSRYNEGGNTALFFYVHDFTPI